MNDMDAASPLNLGRVARITAGLSLLVAGIVLLVLPGPGIPLLLAGLALLARDLPWARRLRHWLLERLGPILARGRQALSAVIFRRRPR